MDDSQQQAKAAAAASLAYWLGRIRQAVALEHQKRALEVLGPQPRVALP